MGQSTAINKAKHYFNDPKYVKMQYKKVLESVASDNPCVFWVTAQNNVRKIHFLNSLASILIDKSEDSWKSIRDDEILSYRTRLQNVNLFPVIFSLSPCIEDKANIHPVLDIMDGAIEEALKRRNLQTDISIMPPQNIYEWYKNLPTDLRIELDLYIRGQVHFYFKSQTNSIPDQSLSKIVNLDKLADLILEYCRLNNLKPRVISSMKQRIGHIYDKITNLADGKLYTGLLFIIDDFDPWQQSLQQNNQSYTEAEDLLKTLVCLPWEENLRIYTFIISKGKLSTKGSRADYRTRIFNIRL